MTRHLLKDDDLSPDEQSAVLTRCQGLGGVSRVVNNLTEPSVVNHA